MNEMKNVLSAPDTKREGGGGVHMPKRKIKNFEKSSMGIRAPIMIVLWFTGVRGGGPWMPRSSSRKDDGPARTD